MELWKQSYNLTPVGCVLEKLITDIPFFCEEDEKVSERPARMLRQCAWVIHAHSDLQNKSEHKPYHSDIHFK